MGMAQFLLRRETDIMDHKLAILEINNMSEVPWSSMLFLILLQETPRTHPRERASGAAGGELSRAAAAWTTVTTVEIVPHFGAVQSFFYSVDVSHVFHH